MDLNLLRTQHAEITDAARLLADAIAQSVQPPGVGQLRWRLARLLMTHLALEDRIVYPTLQRSLDADQRAQAALLQRQMGGLAQRFADYTAGWSDDRITREWPLFCSETRLILEALDARIALEDRFYGALRADPDKRVGRCPCP
ncbi:MULTISPECIES: hemerythrin domain-containing protein [unclassified Sphingobium]|uniref:hemerythrin domain-containing protein n=1 Tax=unclassified Sphingobium TaxID=2611147 RepID=UPI0035A6015F